MEEASTKPENYVRGTIHKAFTLAVLASAAFPCHAVLGGKWLDTVPESAYLNMATDSQFAGSGYILGTMLGSDGKNYPFIASGTLISSQWVLTAGHIVSPGTPIAQGVTAVSVTDTSFTLANGFTSNISQQVSTYTGDLSAGNDLGLFKLTTAVPSTGPTAAAPAALYTTTDEMNKTITMVGWGVGGTGISGADSVNYPAGTKRAGQNTVDVFGGDWQVGGYSNKIMFADFDSPTDPTKSLWGSSTPLPNEYITAPGDSGGGVFIQVGNQQLLAGVTSVGLHATGTPGSQYGNASGFTRVSLYSAWIGNTISGTDSTTVSSGATLTAASIQQNALIVNGAAKISPTNTPNSAASTTVLTSLTVAGSSDAWSGQLDLGNNSLIIKGGGSGVRDTVANEIRQGMGLTTVIDPGHHGITSSTALNNGAGDTTLGFALASDLQPSETFSFGGQTVGGNDVLVKYTWKADANLDGIVNVADLGILATNYGLSGKSWVTADFNGDGLVNVADLGLLATYYGRGTSPGSPLLSFQNALVMFPQFGGGGTGGGDVPEPMSLGILGLGALGLVVRGRRR